MSDKNNMLICYEIIRFVVFLMVVLLHWWERMIVLLHWWERMDGDGKAFALGGGMDRCIPDNPNPIVYHGMDIPCMVGIRQVDPFYVCGSKRIDSMKYTYGGVLSGS